MTYDEAYPEEGGGPIRQLNDTMPKSTPPLLEINPATKQERLTALGNKVFRRLQDYTVYEANERIADFHMKERGFHRTLPELLLKYLPEKGLPAETGQTDSGHQFRLSGLYKNGEVVMYGDEYAQVHLGAQDSVRLFRFDETVGSHIYFDFPIESKDEMDKLRPLPDGENADEIKAAWDRMHEKGDLIGAGTAIARLWKPVVSKMSVPEIAEERKRLRRQRAQEAIEEKRLREGKLPKVAKPVATGAARSPFSEEE